MKNLVLSLLLLGFMPFRVFAQEAPVSVKSAALAELAILEQDVGKKKAKRMSAAAAALSMAGGSESGAVALFLKCKEESFKEAQKKPADFMEWKTGEFKRIQKKPAFAKGLRLQCYWTYLSLKKSEADRLKMSVDLTKEASSVIESLTADATLYLQDKSGLTGGEMAEIKNYLLIRSLKTKDWVNSPGEFGGIFDKIIFPAVKSSRNINALRSAWMRYINLEKRINFDAETLAEMLQKEAEKKDSSKGGRPREATTDRDIALMVTKIGAEVNPKHVSRVRNLYWRMEKDCYMMGDQKRALDKLMAYVKEIKDPEEQEEKIAQLRDLLSKTKEELEEEAMNSHLQNTSTEGAGEENASSEDGSKTTRSKSVTSSGNDESSTSARPITKKTSRVSKDDEPTPVSAEEEAPAQDQDLNIFGEPASTPVPVKQESNPTPPAEESPVQEVSEDSSKNLVPDSWGS